MTFPKIPLYFAFIYNIVLKTGPTLRWLMRGKPVRLDSGQIEVLDDSMAEVLRKKQPAERIRIGFDIWTSAHTMLTAHLTSVHPDWDRGHVEREVARRFLHGAL